MQFFVLLFLLFSVAAFAADPPSKTPQTPAASSRPATPCGATVTEGMQSVQKALASSDSAAEHDALVCLTQIVAAMNDKIGALDADLRHNTTGRVTMTTEPVQAQKQ